MAFSYHGALERSAAASVEQTHEPMRHAGYAEERVFFSVTAMKVKPADKKNRYREICLDFKLATASAVQLRLRAAKQELSSQELQGRAAQLDKLSGCSGTLLERIQAMNIAPKHQFLAVCVKHCRLWLLSRYNNSVFL